MRVSVCARRRGYGPRVERKRNETLLGCTIAAGLFAAVSVWSGLLALGAAMSVCTAVLLLLWSES